LSCLLFNIERRVIMCRITCETFSPFPLKAIFGRGLLFVLVIIAAAVPPATAQTCTGIPNDECQALCDLYNSTGGDQWTDNTNWLSTQPVDDWCGVSVSNGHVTNLSLYEYGLVGEIPAEIGQLTELSGLYLH